MKKMLCYVLVLSLLSSVTAFAGAFRIDTNDIVEIPSRRARNDVIYMDFTDVEPGTTPPRLSTTSAGVTTQESDVGGKVVKNNYILRNDATTGRNIVTLNTDGLSGIVGFEMRYKFTSVDGKDFSTFLVQFYNINNKMFHRYLVSSGGEHKFDGGWKNFDHSAVKNKPETWYRLKYVINFDEQTMGAQLWDESENWCYQVLRQPFECENDDALTKIVLDQQTQGQWTIDYIKLSQEETNLIPVYQESKIEKGRPVEKIATPVSRAVNGRINITLDGKYKYTTKSPKLKENKVLVTAKNIATIFNMAYHIKDDKAYMSAGNHKFEISLDGSKFLYNDNSLDLGAKPIAENAQIYVPIEDICRVMGYTCEYSADTNTVSIITQ